MQLIRYSVLVLLLASESFAAMPPEKLSVAGTPNGVEIRLPTEPVAPLAGTQYRLKIEASSDLNSWSPAGEMSPGVNTAFVLQAAADSTHRFFRLRPELDDSGVDLGGEEIFGYDRIFREELRRVGFLTPEEFAVRNPYPSNQLDAIGFDPRRAKYWDAFNADPAVVNIGLATNSPSWRSFDFRLNPPELDKFRQNGFVVSERLGSFSFADVFYRIFNDDMPVFVSADAALHAWHYSYQRLLEESEETQLAPALQQILDAMKAQLAVQPDAVRNGPLKDSFLDADFFITVGQSLLAGQQQPSAFGVDARVSTALAAIANQQYIPDPPGFDLFGVPRAVDFSQFKIRGHYERSVGLGRYFQAFMWTARADLRIYDQDNPTQSLHELGTAIVLTDLLKTSGATFYWQPMDNLIRLFVGRADEMTLGQLQVLLGAAGISGLSSVSAVDLIQLQTALRNGTYGEQLIAGDVYQSPFGPEQAQLPRSFAFTGQRFVPDGWALTQVIFDRIQWNEDIPNFTVFGKVARKFASALDVVYAVLGNRQTGPEIAQRMLDLNSRANFRDGLPYAHNLTAVAATFDRMLPAAWQDSIYTRWLAALRTLSPPTTDTRFPQSMRTRAWAMRTLNTQLASYTELKHDTVLYAKQPYAAIFLCDYPAGFVEPVPEFWQKMKELAEATASGLESLPLWGSITVQPNPDPSNPFLQPIVVDLAARNAARVTFCHNFAQQMAMLENLAAKELQQQPFTASESDFIRGLMNRQDHPYFGATFDGWYPSLFYKDYGQLGGADTNGSNKEDPLVTDIQTAPPDQIDPIGGVLHEATGNVDMMMITVDNGLDLMMYAGPVMSHYEFILPGPVLQRLSDSEWQTQLATGASTAQRPDWTRNYLVPKP